MKKKSPNSNPTPRRSSKKLLTIRLVEVPMSVSVPPRIAAYDRGRSNREEAWYSLRRKTFAKLATTAVLLSTADMGAAIATIFATDQDKRGESTRRDNIPSHGKRSSATAHKISSTKVTSPSLVVFDQKVSMLTKPATRQNNAANKNSTVALTRENTSAPIKPTKVRPASHSSMS